MRNLAKDLNVTPMALYRHYTDKDDLIDALTSDALDEWHKLIAAVRAPSALGWLEGMMEAFLDFALQTPRRFEAAFILPARNARRFPHDVIAGHSPPLNLILAHIEQAQREGALCDAPASEIAMMFWALGQGLVSLFFANRFTSEAEFRAVYRSAIRRCFFSYSRTEPQT